MGFLSKKKHYGGESGDGRDDVIEAVRKATNKHLTRPDAALNQRVVSTINTCPSDVDARSIASVFIGRMRQENPHKQWLTIVLSQRVLRDCKERIADGKQELLQEIAAIAAKPVATHIVNASAAQKAKQEAYTVLQEHGDDGMSAMSMAGGAGAVNLLVNDQAGSSGRYEQPTSYSSEFAMTRGAASPSAAGSAVAAANWADLKAKVTAEIQVAKNQTDVLQDMLKNFKNGNGNFERSFFEELTAQMVSFRLTFEAHMARLTNFQTDEAMTLMSSAIDTVEKMNEVLTQYHELMVAPKAPASSATPVAAREEPTMSLIDLGDALPPPPPSATPEPRAPAAAALADPFGSPPAFGAPTPVHAATTAPATNGLRGLLDDLLDPAAAPASAVAPAAAHAAALAPALSTASSGGNPFGDPAPPAAPPATAAPFGTSAPPLQLPQQQQYGGVPTPPPAAATDGSTFPGFSTPAAPSANSTPFAAAAAPPPPRQSPFGSDATFSTAGGGASPTSSPWGSAGGPSPGGLVLGGSTGGVPSPGGFGRGDAPSPAGSFALSTAGSGFSSAALSPANSNPFASPTAAASPGSMGMFGGGAPASPGMNGGPFGNNTVPEPNPGLLSLGKPSGGAGATYNTQGPLADLDPLPKAPKVVVQPRGAPMRAMSAAAGATATITAGAAPVADKAAAAAPAVDAFDELLTRR